MIKNMCPIDRMIKKTVALALGVLILTGQVAGTLAIVLGLLAVILLATSAVSTCPLYLPLRISTRKADEGKK